MTDAGLESLAESVPGLQKLYLNGALLIDFSPLLRLENLEQINMYVGDGLALRETLKDTAVEINNEM